MEFQPKAVVLEVGHWALGIRPQGVRSGLFEAALDATEEAVYNSLLKAADVTSAGRTVRAIPIDELRALLRKYAR